MGIDIYARWKGMTKKEEEKQATGFSIHHGHVGYLREAYHGEPYATMELCKEAFSDETNKVEIPAEVLKQRLPKVLQLARERETKIYKGNELDVWNAQKSFIDFVKLCEAKEKKTGKPCTITASY